MAEQNRTVTVRLKIEGGKGDTEALKNVKSQLDGIGKQADVVSKKSEQVFGKPAAGKLRQFVSDFAGSLNKAYTGILDKLSGSLGSAGKTAAGPKVPIPKLGGAGKAAGAAGEAAGGLGGLGGVAKAAGAAALVYGGVNASADLARLSADKYMTDAQRGREFFRNNVPGGQTIQGWIDSFTGRAGAMQDVEVGRAKMGANRSIAAERVAFDVRSRPAMAGAEERLVQAEKSGIKENEIDRSTAKGEQEFRFASRELPVRRELAKAEREAAVATKERKQSELEVSRLSSAENSLYRERIQLQDRLKKDDSSGPERQQLLADLEDVNKRMEIAARSKQGAAEASTAARNREADANRNVAQQRAALSEARAANLEDQAATSAGGARRLGGMNAMDRGFAVQAVKMVQQFGPDAVPPEVLAAAQAAAPDTIGKITEKRGAETEQFKELQKIAPADFGPEGSTPEKLRQQARDARNEAEGSRTSGEIEFANAAKDAGKELARINADAFRTLLEAYKLDIETQIRIQKGQQ